MAAMEVSAGTDEDSESPTEPEASGGELLSFKGHPFLPKVNGYYPTMM